MDRTIDIYPFDMTTRHWLEGYELTSLEAAGTGHAPSARDLRQSLDQLRGYVTAIMVRGPRWQATVTNALNDWDRVWMAAEDYSGCEMAPLHLTCEGRDPLSALRIIRHLSRTCGPQVAIPDAAWPALIGPETDIDAILDGWRWEWEELATDPHR